MKKTVALMTCLIVIAAVFFYSPVFAASQIRLNYMGRVQNTKIDQNTGITMYTSVTVLYPESDSGMANGSTAELMITARLYNPSTTYSGFVYMPTLEFTFTSNNNYPVPKMTGVDNQSPDLFVGDDFNNYGSLQKLRIYSSAAYGRGDGVIIPPGSSLYLVSQVTVNCTYEVSANNVIVPVLDSVAINGGAFALGDYSYAGEPTDLSQIQTAINTINTNTDQIESLLNSIKNELIPNANFYSPAYNTPQYFSVSHNTGLQYFYMTASIYSGNSYIETDNIDHFDEYHVFERVVPITISLAMENYYSYAVAQTGAQTNTALVITDLLPRDQRISYTIGEYDSNVFDIPRVADIGSGNYDLLVFDYKNAGRPTNSAYCGLVPIGSNHSTFVIYAHIRGDAQLVLNSSMTISSSYTFQITDIYLKSTDMMLSDIYSYLNKEDQSVEDQADDVTDDAQDIATQIETVHQQEMQYFEDNQDAIEATGLSNFHFNNNTISAFTMITNQFTSLWNALGDYTLVFIFTLLLSLATYIIKHEPTTKVKQYRSSVAAERAERISYYSKKNAYARANQKSDGDDYFWNAVQRINRGD